MKTFKTFTFKHPLTDTELQIDAAYSLAITTIGGDLSNVLSTLAYTNGGNRVVTIIYTTQTL